MSQYTDKAKQHMDKCLEALQANFSRVRTGRANPHILDPIKVDYYGQPTPITQLAGVKVPSGLYDGHRAVGQDRAQEHREGHRGV